MRTQTVSVSAVAASAWIPLNAKQSPFNVSLGVDFDSAASGVTYTVEHTFDDLGDFRPVTSITRSTTTVTVTFPSTAPHNLNTGDSLVVQGSGVTGMDGTFTVTASSATVVTYTSGTSGTATGAIDTRVVPLRVFPHASLAAKTTTSDSNYAYPVTATRLNVTVWTAGKTTLIVNQGR